MTSASPLLRVEPLMPPAFAAVIRALRSAAESVPQAGVAGAEPVGLLTARAWR